MKSLKKIGILTFFSYFNYGTVLQAYALQEKIRELGQASEILDYCSLDNKKTTSQKILGVIKNPSILVERISKKIDRIIYSKKIQATVKRYEEFKNMLQVTNKKYYVEADLKECVEDYSAFMVGSDQTWNTYLPIVTNAFFLSFVPNNKAKLSYAPSLGGNKFSREKQEEMVKQWKNFDKLSCREDFGVELISKTTSKRVVKVLDPTLLIAREKWEKISTKLEIEDKEYVLCYVLGKRKENFEIIERFAKEKNLPLYYIYNFDTKLKKKRNYLYGVGPREFIGLIKNARYIFTDSFHGTIFSLLFNREFFTFTKKLDGEGSDNNRLYELLKNFEIEDRYVKKYSDISNVKEINYENINKKMNEQKEKSVSYLKECLNYEKE